MSRFLAETESLPDVLLPGHHESAESQNTQLQANAPTAEAIKNLEDLMKQTTDKKDLDSPWK